MFPAIYTIIKYIFSSYFFVGYITNNKSFPQPLSPEEEEEMLTRYSNGDHEARDILIERNLRLVAHISKKYTINFKDSDDLISIGTIGLIKAISSFDKNKGIRLATFAARCIENEILMHLRASKKLLNEVSLQDPIGVDKEGNEITLMDILDNDCDPIIDHVELKFQIKKLYQKMKKVLKGREKKVLEMRYGLTNGTNRTQMEIAKILGISRSYVSRIEKKAVQKLRREFSISTKSNL